MTAIDRNEEQLVAARRLITKLQTKIRQFEEDDDRWPEYGLTSDQEASLRRVHRYLCESDPLEAVRELQHSFPELGLRPLAIERSLIPEGNFHVS